MNCREFAQQLEITRDEATRLSPGAAPDVSPSPSEGSEPSPSLAAAALQQHAQACASCARLLRAESDLRAGLASLREAAASVDVPQGFARQVRRAAEKRAAARAPRATWPLAAGFAAAAGVLAATLLVLGPEPIAPARVSGMNPVNRAPVSSGGAHDGESAGSPVTPAGMMPVVYSDRGVDILGPEPQAPIADGGTERVAVLVEWNL